MNLDAEGKPVAVGQADRAHLREVRQADDRRARRARRDHPAARRGDSCRFDDVSVAAVRTPAEYEAELQRYLFERSEEGRAVRVGEKEVSEQAAIVAALRRTSSRASRSTRSASRRMRRQATTASGSTGCARRARPGSIAAELAERDDALENAILAARVPWQGEELPLRTAQAKLAVLAGLRRARGARRAPGAEVGRVQRRAARADPRGRGARGGAVRRARSGRAQRRRRSRSRSANSSARSPTRATRATASCERMRAALVRAAARPGARRRAELARTSRSMRRLSPLESTYTKERAVEVCMDTLSRARLRPRERAEHAARPRGPPAEVAARVRDRVRPAEGRPPDHAGAGRPPRLPGVPARGRPRAALRGLSTRRSRTRSARSRATTR